VHGGRGEVYASRKRDHAEARRRWPGCPIVGIDDRLYTLPEWEHARETYQMDELAACLSHPVVSFACLANI
jgi:hypothetical protein